MRLLFQNFWKMSKFSPIYEFLHSKKFKFCYFLVAAALIWGRLLFQAWIFWCGSYLSAALNWGRLLLAFLRYYEIFHSIYNVCGCKIQKWTLCYHYNWKRRWNLLHNVSTHCFKDELCIIFLPISVQNVVTFKEYLMAIVLQVMVSVAKKVIETNV